MTFVSVSTWVLLLIIFDMDNFLALLPLALACYSRKYIMMFANICHFMEEDLAVYLLILLDPLFCHQ